MAGQASAVYESFPTRVQAIFFVLNGSDVQQIYRLLMSQQPAIDQSVLLVAGVVRDGERRMRRDLNAIRSCTAVAGFKDVRWLIIESDSTDRTVQILQALSNEWAAFRFVSLGQTKDNFPQRTDRIAHSRNAYLAALESDPRYRDVTHLMVSDLDGVSGGLTAAALSTCWSLSEPWSAITANQGDYYYDVWALRHPTWSPNDAWALRNSLVPLMGEAQADQLALFSRMVHIPRSAALIEVDSAFGGLAIYRRDALGSARYTGLTADGSPICEHVSFHAHLRSQGYRIFINPALVNAEKTKHAGRKKFWRSSRRAAWNWIRGKSWR